MAVGCLWPVSIGHYHYFDRSGNARVNTGFVHTAQVLSGLRLKTGLDGGGSTEGKI